MSEVYVTKPFLPPLDEYVRELQDIWENSYLTNDGRKYEQLADELKKYITAPNINLLVNGHSALELVLEAMELKGEIITTPFTFISTTNAIVRKGLTPIFCDINSEDYTIDSNKIENLITEKTCAILPVHVYGNICDTEKIQCIADKYNLKVIYDAAHAFGERKNGEAISNFGDASIMSFHATKIFHTIEGGAVISKHKNIIERINSIKNFGISSSESADYIGANYKMNEFQAAMGICNLRYIDEIIEKRKKITERYDEMLSGYKGIKLRNIQKNTTSNYAYYPVFFDGYKKTRDEVYHELMKEKIFSRKYFYPLVTEFECYNQIHTSNITPIAKYYSDRVLCLPIYTDLTSNDIEKICSIIKK